MAKFHNFILILAVLWVGCNAAPKLEEMITAPPISYAVVSNDDFYYEDDDSADYYPDYDACDE